MAMRVVARDRDKDRDRDRDRDRDSNNMMGGVMRRRVMPMEGVKELALNDPEFLRRFVTEQGKIMPRRRTGCTPEQQRQIAKAIRRARIVGLVK